MILRVLYLLPLVWLLGEPAQLVLSDTKESTEAPLFQTMRHDMVEKQLEARGIQNPRVLEAMRKVPRHLFVPEVLRLKAYVDSPLPIGHDQTISQPYIVAYMTEMLEVLPEDRVLEIGTGSGYQAAVLAELAREVYTIEILESLYRTAKEVVESLGYRNVFFSYGDGWKGWPEKAPFDKIIVTAAASDIPQELVEQLKEEGRMILPLGEELQHLIIGEKRQGKFQTTRTIPVRFVPLVHGTDKTGKGKGDEKEG